VHTFHTMRLPSSSLKCLAIFLTTVRLPAHAQSEIESGPEMICHPGSGERTAYTVVISNATTVDGLGAVDCAPGYVRSLAGYCDASCYGIADACARFGVCSAEGCTAFRLTWVTPAPFVTCDDERDSNFSFHGCGCPSGHYFDLSYDSTRIKQENLTQDDDIILFSIGSPTLSHARCRECDAGTYSVAGSTSRIDCEMCTPGRYDADGVATTPCVDCVAGNFTVDPLRCDDRCPPGTYASPGSTTDADCERCSPGKFDDDLSAATSCVRCAAGQYGVDLFLCEVCMANNYAPAGSSSCAPCPAGRMAPAQSKDIETCTCTDGTFSINEHTSAEGCAAVASEQSTNCSKWVSDGTPTPCLNAASTCIYTPAVELMYGCTPCAVGKVHYKVESNFSKIGIKNFEDGELCVISNIMLQL
jgi:hypothetical protein